VKQVIGAAAVEVAEQIWASVVQVSNGHGAGAGTIWRPDGVIVTNHHVAPGAKATVLLADGRSYAARAIARDPGNDLAVLQIDATGLPAVTVGDPRRLRPGEIVLAVGHPFGVKNAVTVGLVGGISRGGPREREMIHADVLLGPGNSGGPLANARGEVVGINSMVAGELALAVPSYLAERLLAGTGEERPMIGVALQNVELTPSMAARAAAQPGQAAMVVGVREGSPAEQAGLQLGDVLLALDGRPLGGADALVAALAAHPGGPIRVRLLRGGVAAEAVILPAQPTTRAA
jgi:serine protease Do